MNPVTLQNLPQKTEQEVFEWIVVNLLRQGKPSISENKCQYRSGENKCAAGWLMADDEYRTVMECCPWGQLVELNLVPDVHRILIIKCQAVHDNFVYFYSGETTSFCVREWKKNFIRIAIERELDYSFIDECFRLRTVAQKSSLTA